MGDGYPGSEWPALNQHKSLQGKVDVATSFFTKSALVSEGDTMLVDGMDEAFLKTYGAWPLRFYIVERKHNTWILSYCAQPTSNYVYDLDEVAARLREMTK